MARSPACRVMQETFFAGLPSLTLLPVETGLGMFGLPRGMRWEKTDRVGGCDGGKKARPRWCGWEEEMKG